MTPFERAIAEALATLNQARDQLEEAAYQDLMRSMLVQEREIVGKIKTLAAKLDTAKDGEILNTQVNLGRARHTLKEIRQNIDLMSKQVPHEWAAKWLPKSYYLGREQLKISIEAAQILGHNVDPLLAAFKAVGIDPLLSYPVKTSLYRVEEAYASIGKDFQQWMGKELTGAIESGIPIGNFTDIGKDRPTLIGNLLKSDTELRGYTTESGVHISAERHALAIARNEMTAIDNEVALQDAARLGLDWCYNANPDDINTTSPCKDATEAGPMPFVDMKEQFGVPPRIGPQYDPPYHLCRSKLIFVDKEWLGE